MSNETLTLAVGNLTFEIRPEAFASLQPGDATLLIVSEGEFSTTIKGDLGGDELRQLAALFITAANGCDQAVAKALENSKPHLQQTDAPQ